MKKGGTMLGNGKQRSVSTGYSTSLEDSRT